MRGGRFEVTVDWTDPRTGKTGSGRQSANKVVVLLTDGVPNLYSSSDSAINIQLWMPENWNGRFLFHGGGGLNGSVQPPYGTSAAGSTPPANRVVMLSVRLTRLPRLLASSLL